MIGGEVSVIIDSSAMAAVNCAGVGMNGSCTDSPAKSGFKLLSASEGEREEGPYIVAFELC